MKKKEEKKKNLQRKKAFKGELETKKLRYLTDIAAKFKGG